MPHQVKRRSITLGLLLALAVCPPAWAIKDAGDGMFGGTVERGGGGADIRAIVSKRGSGGAASGGAPRRGGGAPANGGGASREVTLFAGVLGDAQAQQLQASNDNYQKNCAWQAGADPTVLGGHGLPVQCQKAPAGSPVAFVPDPAVLGQTAVLDLNLPASVPEIGPDPSLNEWNLAMVGYPLWVSADNTDTAQATMNVWGFPVQLSAVRKSLEFDMGDGNTITCTSTTPWSPGVAPGAESPDCGYAYQQVGNYEVIAVANWEVTWSVLGQTGVVPIEKAGAIDLPVGELQSVNR